MPRLLLLVSLIAACDGGSDSAETTDDSGTTTDTDTDTDTTPGDACAQAIGVPCDQVEQAYLKGASAGQGATFGFTIAHDDDTLAITARGTEDDRGVFVFVKANGEWVEQARLRDPYPGFPDDNNPFENWKNMFGFELALSGDTLVVGAPRDDSGGTGVGADATPLGRQDTGAVHVFQRSGETWSHQTYIKPPTNGNVGWFGQSVVMQGDDLFVGAPLLEREAEVNLQSVGGAYHYARSGSTWTLVETLQSTHAEEGSQSGIALALDGDLLVMGSYEGVFTFRPSGTGTWTESSKITDASVRDVAVDGTTVVIGQDWDQSTDPGVGADPTDSSGTRVGAVRVFTASGESWTEQAYIKASNPGDDDVFGRSLDLDGNRLVVGAPGESSAEAGLNADGDNDVARGAGAVYLFEREGSTWTQVGYLKPSVVGSDDWFGSAVLLSGSQLFVGAPGDDSAATSISGDPTDNSSINAGATWEFRVFEQ